MKSFFWLLLPLSVILSGCSEDSAKSEDYYYNHPEEAQDVVNNCQFSERERETTNCKNASHALNRVTGEALTN